MTESRHAAMGAPHVDRCYEVMVSFNPASGQYRGEFAGPNDGADFYARDRVLLRLEGARSMAVPLAGCMRSGVAPKARA